jgi:hypothetical protein
MLSSKAAMSSVDTAEHIAYLLEVIRPAFDNLKALQAGGCEMDVFCYLEMDGQGGPSISSALMRSMSEFGLDLTWDIYSS